MQPLLKATAFGVAGLVGSALRITQWQGLFVYLFHDVTDAASPFEKRFGLAVSPTLFRRQIEWICSHHQVIHPREMDSPHLPRRSALITFDDGFHGVFEHALPLLEALDVPATLFLNLGVASGEPNVAELAAFLEESEGMSRPGPSRDKEMHRIGPSRAHKDLSELSAAQRELLSDFGARYALMNELEDWDGHPLFRFGNHLWNHYSALALTRDELSGQYKRNEAGLKRFKSHIPWFAFPFGRNDTKCLLHLGSLGASRMFGGAPLQNMSVGEYLHRYQVGPGYNSHLKLTGALTLGRVITWKNAFSGGLPSRKH